MPLDIAWLGEWSTPFWVGNENRGELRRIGFEATTGLNRHDFGVSWQAEAEARTPLSLRHILATVDARQTP